MNGKIKYIAITGLVSLSVGCSVKTNPVTPEEVVARVANDRTEMFANQAPITGAITIGEAMARALSYNLDHRLKQMEAAVAARQFDFDKYGLLPDLVADAGYSRRNNSPAARSEDDFGEETLPNSTSQERTTETSSLELSWNILDFGLSYYTARQASNQVLVAEERRRKTVQNITQDVIDAFWKAWMAQSVGPKVEALIAENRSALDQSRSLVSQGVQNPEAALGTQGAMLNNINSLIETRERIALSKVRLAALINVDPALDYQVVAPVSLEVPGELTQSPTSMVEFALLNRPELREEDYRKRVSELEVRKTFLNYFPSLNLSAAYNRDENRFLENRTWNTVGWDVTWDLLGLLQVHKQKQFNEAEVEVADARRMALSMAVMTQVYIAISRFELSRESYDAATQLFEVRNSLARNSAARGSRASGMDELNARSSSISSELRRNLAFAETQAAFARVVNSMGIDPVPSQVESHSLEVLSREFDSRWASMIRGNLTNY